MGRVILLCTGHWRSLGRCRNPLPFLGQDATPVAIWAIYQYTASNLRYNTESFNVVRGFSGQVIDSKLYTIPYIIDYRLIGLSHLKWTWFEHTRPLLDLPKYDDASRGPLGATKLLWALGRRYSKVLHLVRSPANSVQHRGSFVASVGAVVTILALGVDPFVQQIVRYYTCVKPTGRIEASIPRVNTYEDPGAFHNGAGSVALGIGTQAAISAGAFSAAAFSLLFNCSTGNCTFERPYSSVGFCSRCSDISTELRITNYTYVNYNPAYGNATVSQLNYTLPSGLYVAPTDSGQVFAMGGYPANEYPPGPPIAAVEAIYKPPTKRSCASGDDSWACRGYGAARCELIPCLKEYNATIQSSFLVSYPNLQVAYRLSARSVCPLYPNLRQNVLILQKPGVFQCLHVDHTLLPCCLFIPSHSKY